MPVALKDKPALIADLPKCPHNNPVGQISDGFVSYCEECEREAEAPALTIYFPTDPESAEKAVAAFLATVPDDALTREYMRRLNARRVRDRAGRKPKLKACKFCREKFGAVDMRVHIPRCEAKKKAQKKGGR